MQALDEEKDVEVGDSEQSMPVIIKKEHDNLGMLEYNKEQEDKLLRVIITELKPRLASQMLPGLPAYILFMLIRHLDHINDDKNVRSLIQGAISQVKKTSAHFAALDMFKNIFPRGTTWNDVKTFISAQKS